RHSRHEVTDWLWCVEFSIPLLSFGREGELHIVSAQNIFKRSVLHFEDEGPECFRKDVQVRPFPSLYFVEVFRFASLRGKRTSCKTSECIEDAMIVVPMGKLFEDFAEVV